MDAVEKIFSPALTVGKPANAADAVDVQGSVSAATGVPHSSVPAPADAANVTDEQTRTASMCALADFVMKHMRVNYDARKTAGIDDRLKYAIMAQTCTFDDVQKKLIESFGLDPKRVYTPITSTKIRSVYSMLMELSQYGSDVPFEIHASPDPEVPQEVENEVLQQMYAEITQIFALFEQSGVKEIPPDAMEKLKAIIAKASSDVYDRVSNAKDEFARTRAARMQKKVWDLMFQGGFDKARMKCLSDFCTYGTTVMVGPVMRNVARNKSVTKKLKKGGKVRVIKRVIESIPTYERISPVDCYPSPDAEEVTDGVLCVRVRYTKEELWRYRRSSSDDKAENEGGWRDSAIARLLADNEYGCRLNEFPVDRDVEDAENKGGEETRVCKFEGVRCFAYVYGHDLIELGITKSQDGETIDNDGFYYTETIVIGGLVVFCRIYDERMGMPLSKSVFYNVPGSWWGESIADKLVATQTTMNNAIISLLRNMGPASASMMWMNDVTRLVDKSPDGLAAEPGKIYAFASSYTGQSPSSGAPMGVLQIPSNASELLAVAKWATQQADIDSGIPAFAEGTGGSNGGALRTAEGLRTFTEHMSRGVKAIGRNYDEGVNCGPARLTADWVLINDDDMELKGDVEVRPIGIMGKILKAQNDQLRLQILNLCLNSQFMQGILGVKGILALFRPSLKDTNINPDDVAPSKERIEFLEGLEGLKQIVATIQAKQGISDVAAQTQNPGGGMSPGVAPVEKVQGAVANRRGAA